MNPLDWSFGWTLVAAVAGLAAALAVWFIQELHEAPTLCNRCDTLVSRDAQARHDRMHAELDAAFAEAEAEHHQAATSAADRTRSG